MYYKANLFHRHHWVVLDKTVLETALKRHDKLVTVDKMDTKVFFDKIIYVFQCEKCKKLRFWKP